MGGLFRSPEQVPPRRADLGEDVAPGNHPGAAQRRHQAVYAAVSSFFRIGPFRGTHLVAGVIDHELDRGVGDGGRADIDR